MPKKITLTVEMTALVPDRLTTEEIEEITLQIPIEKIEIHTNIDAQSVVIANGEGKITGYTTTQIYQD